MGKNSRGGTSRKVIAEAAPAPDDAKVKRSERLWGTGRVFAVIGVLIAIAVAVVPLLKNDPAPKVRVFLAACEPKSDIELGRNAQMIMFVHVPRLEQHANRLVLGTMIVRPVNVGERSISDLTLTTVFDRSLWHESLASLDYDAWTPLFGSKEPFCRPTTIDDKWIIARPVPRLDPMSGAPSPVSFILQFAAGVDTHDVVVDAKGFLEIRASGPDWAGVAHKIDIRGVPADNGDAFLQSVERTCRALRSEGYPDVPVIMAVTGGEGYSSTVGGPLIAQARIVALLERQGSSLYDY